MYFSQYRKIFILNVKNEDSTSFITQSHCSVEMMFSWTLFSCIMALTSIFSIYQWLIRCYFVIKEATHFHFFVALTPQSNFVRWLFMCGLLCHRFVGLLYILHTDFILIQKNHSFLPFKISNFLCYPLTFHLLPFGLTLECKAKKYVMSFWLIFFEYGSRMHFKSIQYTVIEKPCNPFLAHVLFLKNKIHWNHKQMLY
jgi:hypothetical protein